MEEEEISYIGIYKVYRVRVPNIRVTFRGGPYDKDYSMRGSILESSYLGELPFGHCGLHAKHAYIAPY